MTEDEFLCAPYAIDDILAFDFENYLSDIDLDRDRAIVSGPTKQLQALQDAAGVSSEYEFEILDEYDVLIRHQDQIVGYYYGPVVSVADDHRGDGLGALLVAAATLVRDAPPQSEYDEAGYTKSGLASHRRGFELLAKANLQPSVRGQVAGLSPG